LRGDSAPAGSQKLKSNFELQVRISHREGAAKVIASQMSYPPDEPGLGRRRTWRFALLSERHWCTHFVSRAKGAPFWRARTKAPKALPRMGWPRDHQHQDSKRTAIAARLGTTKRERSWTHDLSANVAFYRGSLRQRLQRQSAIRRQRRQRGQCGCGRGRRRRHELERCGRRYERGRRDLGRRFRRWQRAGPQEPSRCGSICTVPRPAVIPTSSNTPCKTADGGVCENMPCVVDSDCTQGINGRCSIEGPGAPRILCTYDECSSDADCAPNRPCQCREAGSSTENFCVTQSGCSVDADCGPGGFCSPTLFNQWCGGSYQCHTAEDTCLDDSDCTDPPGCNFNATLAHWACGGQLRQPAPLIARSAALPRVKLLDGPKRAARRT
jgi:hypothetical protein